MKPTNAQQLTKGIDKLCNLSLEMDASNETATIRYTDADAMNALHLFYHVCGNIMIHNMREKGVTLEQGKIIAEEMGELLADTLMTMTGIDSRTYYKK